MLQVNEYVAAAKLLQSHSILRQRKIAEFAECNVNLRIFRRWRAVVKMPPDTYTDWFVSRCQNTIIPGPAGPAVVMRFKLLDRIVDLKPGASITAVKGLALSEDYLADHFPQFPVMPGVFMLEAMTQASAWLVRVSEDFKHSMVVLREARNVKYADFVAPGQTLTVTAEVLSQTETETKLKVQGAVDGKLNVGARLVLTRYNLADTNPICASSDAHVIRQMRKQFDLLYRPGDIGQATNGQTTAGQGATPVNRLVLGATAINPAAIQ